MARRAGAALRHIARRRGGYSLAEVLTVIALIGIITAMAVPRIDVSGRQATAAEQAAGLTLTAAQRAAVARQHDVVVAFDVAAAAMRIHYDADNDGRIDGGELVRHEALGSGAVFGRAGAPAYRIGSGPVSFTRTQDGKPAVTFHRNGSASEEGGFYVTSARAEAERTPRHARVVVVDRATGRPTWATYRTEGGWKRDF